MVLRMEVLAGIVDFLEIVGWSFDRVLAVRRGAGNWSAESENIFHAGSAHFQHVFAWNRSSKCQELQV